MNRIRPVFDLPPLEQACPGFAGLTPVPSLSRALLEEIRRLALRLRDRQSHRFYSTRELAHFFRVNPELVRRAFGELRREGLLVTVRSSMTVLTPQQRAPRASVRGVVGLPIWQMGYCRMSPWREFHVCLEEELRRRHFVADLIFFGVNDSQLGERMLNHDLDYVVWYLPRGVNAQLMRVLGDSGVTPIVVREALPAFPAAEYIVSWMPALEAALRDWRQRGVKDIEVLEGYGMPSGSDVLLESCGLPTRHRVPTQLWAADFGRYVRRLKPESKRTLLALENLWNSDIALRFGKQWADLVQKRRMLIRDRHEIASEFVKGATVDLLSADLPRLVARIAEDIASGTLPPQGEPVSHPAVYRPHVPAEDCAQYY